MASIYRRKGSSFLWSKHRDPATGKIVRASTKIRENSPKRARDEKKELAKLMIREASADTLEVRDRERWAAWAAAYIAERYAGKGSLRNANYALQDLLKYFEEMDVFVPRQVNHSIAAGFAKWRVTCKSLDPVSINTAALRSVYLSVLMKEAVRRGFTDFNPCRDIETKREAPKQKQEITKEHEAKIEAALESGPQWMKEQWLILMRHGCRIAETHIPMERIDTESMIITFRIKRGKMHTAQLHPDLLPLIKKAREEGRRTLLGVENVSSWSPRWSQFFQALGMPYSAHCTRVTVITRLVRAGHQVAQICNFIGHTEEVNKIYRKLKPQDSSGLLATLGGASTPS